MGKLFRLSSLVAIEPVSDFILVETHSPDRSADSWTSVINQRLEQMPVHVIQATSDEAKGIIHHVQKDLKAHHSQDLWLFEVLWVDGERPP